MAKKRWLLVLNYSSSTCGKQGVQDFSSNVPPIAPEDTPTKESCKITVDSSPVTTGTVEVSQPFKSSPHASSKYQQVAKVAKKKKSSKSSKYQVKDDGEQAENEPHSLASYQTNLSLLHTLFQHNHPFSLISINYSTILMLADLQIHAATTATSTSCRVTFTALLWEKSDRYLR